VIPAAGADAGAPTLFVRDPVALSHLLREPNEVWLVRAWVDGSRDLERVVALRNRYLDLDLALAERMRLALGALAVGAGPRCDGRRSRRS
jgi:hypothetical protein